MHKKKTSSSRKSSKKPEFSFKDMQETKIAHKKDITVWNGKSSFSDASKVGAALLQCLIDNDTETYIEISESYLRMNKLQAANRGEDTPKEVAEANYGQLGL
jgi:hypothetical protein